MDPKIDFCFKELMSNEYVRRGFIAAVLGIMPEKVAGSTLLPTHLNRDGASDKLGILDIFVRLKDGNRINMEIQIIDYKDWPDRSLFYTGKNLTSQLKKGNHIQKYINASISGSWILNYIQSQRSISWNSVSWTAKNTGNIRIN